MKLTYRELQVKAEALAATGDINFALTQEDFDAWLAQYGWTQDELHAAHFNKTLMKENKK